MKEREALELAGARGLRMILNTRRISLSLITSKIGIQPNDPYLSLLRELTEGISATSLYDS
jgi:hypothetical protein